MTPTELLRCPSDDLIAFSITEAFGERCPTTDADCYTCQAWSQYDKLRAAATPSAEVSVEELAACLRKFVGWDGEMEAARALLDQFEIRRK